MRLTRQTSVPALVFLIVLAVPAIALQQKVSFTPTTGVPTFAVRDPVLKIAPGTIVETKTFSRPGDYYEGGSWPGEVGPFTSRARRQATRWSSGSCGSA
jgi:hypothetical protein